MSVKHKFITWWDFDTDVLYVKTWDANGKPYETQFTKDFLEDTPADKFMELIYAMGVSSIPVLHTAYKSEITMTQKQLDAALNDPAYEPAAKPPPPPINKFQHAINKFALKYGMSPHTVAKIFSQPNEVSEDAYGLSLAAEDAKAAEEIQGMGLPGSKLKTLLGPVPAPQSIGIGYPAVAPALTPAKKDNKMHVYDVGEEMLAPVEMMHAIGHTFITPIKAPSFGAWKVQYVDDFYEPPHPAASKIIVHASAKEEAPPMYPGKVWLVDHAEDVMMLVDDAYADTQKKIMEMVQKKTGMTDLLQGKPKVIAIPKKPKQITAASLAHFYKLLGGKQNPF